VVEYDGSTTNRRWQSRSIQCTLSPRRARLRHRRGCKRRNVDLNLKGVCRILVNVLIEHVQVGHECVKCEVPRAALHDDAPPRNVHESFVPLVCHRVRNPGRSTGANRADGRADCAPGDRLLCGRPNPHGLEPKWAADITLRQAQHMPSCYYTTDTHKAMSNTENTV